MLNLLIDPAPAFYLLLGVVALILGGAWWRTRDRRLLLALLLDLVLLALLVALDLGFESDREQITRKTEAAVAALAKRDVVGFSREVSDQFDYKGRKKDDLRKVLESALARYDVTGWKLRDLEPVDLPEPGVRRLSFNLYLLINGTPSGPLWVEADFTRDADRQWRLLTFRVRRDGGELDVLRYGGG